MKLMRQPAALVGLALGALALTGCGPTLGINPGAAAVVGDRSLSMNKIDSTATLYCEAYAPVLKTQAPTGVPMRYFRQNVAANLTERLLGEQLAAAYDVQPSSEYAAAVANLRKQFAQASSAARDAGIEVEGGDPYLKTVQVSIGRKLLAESGQASPTVQEAFARGQVATQDWLKNHDVKVDPSLGVTVDNGTVSFKRDQTSFPVSTLATLGMANPSSGPDPTYTATLPASQVCRGT